MGAGYSDLYALRSLDASEREEFELLQAEHAALSARMQTSSGADEVAEIRTELAALAATRKQYLAGAEGSRRSSSVWLYLRSPITRTSNE